MALTTGTKIGLAVVVAGAIATLVALDPGEGVLEYLYVEQVVEKMEQNSAHFDGRTIKVHGLVVEGTIKKSKKTGDYRFKVTHGGKTIDVHFTDTPPDTFQEGGEVVLTGQFVEGTFESEEMSAKCPSKYENETKVGNDGGGKALPSKT